MSPMIIATGALGFSIAGLVVLFSLKALEMKSGRSFFGAPDGALRHNAERFLRYMRADFPRTVGKMSRILVKLARAYLSFGLAKLLLVFERVLERVLHRMKSGPAEATTRGEASAFLREIAAYKRMLGKPEQSDIESLE